MAIARISVDKIPVLQHVELYNAQVERHGQNTLWYQASKCWCMTDLGRPDPSHAYCMGRGWIYDPVKQVRRFDYAVGQGNRMLLLAPKYRVAQVNRIFSVADSWTPIGVTGNQIALDHNVEKGRVVSVDFQDDLTTPFAGPAYYEGGNVFRIDVPALYNDQGSFIGKIVAVQHLWDQTQNNLDLAVPSSLGDMWENKVMVNGSIPVVPQNSFWVQCTYVKPLKMVLSQIDPKTAYKNPNVYQQYHAQLITLGTYHVGEGDLITLQTMRQRDSVVATAGIGETSHKLPYFHVERLVRVEWSGGVIKDASLVRNNVIQWGATVPSAGSKFSVTLQYHPTFKVFNDLPNLRYAEDKEFPQKMFLKRYEMFNRVTERPNVGGQGLVQ